MAVEPIVTQHKQVRKEYPGTIVKLYIDTVNDEVQRITANYSGQEVLHIENAAAAVELNELLSQCLSER